MSEYQPSPFAGRLQTMWIVHATLVAGCVMFGAVVMMQPPPRGAAVADVPIVSYISVAFGLAAGSMALLLPGIMAAGLRRKAVQGEGPAGVNTEDQWWALYQTRLIVSAALLEGVVLLALVAYMTEGQTWVLGLAGLFLLLLASLFPTRARVERWVAYQRELVDQAR